MHARIVIVRAGAMGDTLMMTPAIRALRKRYPEAEIDFLCSAAGAELLATNAHLARRMVLRQRNLPYFFSAEKRRLVAELRAREYERAIVLESAAQYRDLLTRAGIVNIRGYAETPFDPALHSIVNYLRVSGFAEARGAELDMELPVSAEARAAASELLAGLARPIVAIHAGYGPGKKKKEQANRLRGWSAQKFSAVARELAAAGASIIFTGSPEDVPLCESIAMHVPAERSRILAGRTAIGEFVASIQAADLLISVDSASAHIAAAVGTPLVVLWGPAIFEQTRPLSSTTPIAILRKSVPCAPCYGTPQMKTCRRNICMEQIEPEEVLAKAREMLSRRHLPVVG